MAGEAVATRLEEYSYEFKDHGDCIVREALVDFRAPRIVGSRRRYNRQRGL